MLGLAALCAFPALAGADPAVEPRQLSTEDLEKLLQKRGRLFILDVREPAEIKLLGSVKGYVNIPFGQLMDRMGEIPKNIPIVAL